MEEEISTSFVALLSPDDEFGATCVCVRHPLVRYGALQRG